MRRIQKGAQPACLITLQCSPTMTSWDDVPGDVKGELREALVREQGGLCAYCMGRIVPSHSGMKIEHWSARHDDPHAVFAWSNLLGVCTGVSGDASEPHDRRFHCDTYRGNLPPSQQELCVHPAGDLRVGVFTFTRVGRIEAHQPQARQDIERLNLNHWRLLMNRKAAYDYLHHRMSDVGYRPAEVERLLLRLRTPGRDGNLREYVGVMEQYIERWLRRHGS